jgi:magnesium chelatase family protein
VSTDLLAQSLSGATLGIDGHPVTVEAAVGDGVPAAFTTIGLPQGAVKEGRERVVAALHNSGYSMPPRRITVSLAPGALARSCSEFDLPIATAILAATGQLAPTDRLARYAVLGELAMDGALRPVRGALPIAIAVRKAGLAGIILPEANVAEAAVVDGLEVRGARTLRETVRFLEGAGDLPVTPHDGGALAGTAPGYGVDFAEVRGQEHVKRALEVAAAGAHNVVMVGPPGSGKTMLAQRIPGILPPLTAHEALETAAIYSVAGLISSTPLAVGRPFRNPHQTLSDVGLVGGGSNPHPGEVSLAHNGVLFLDELAEFRQNVLEAIREPLETGRVTLCRAAVSLTYPSRFMLVAAMNP